ncbi:MAG: hypothetical protein HY903_12315 [Deltaproteobacteria bacterium]|nr:hypothetical protein [Deltaproteobacteria bacterium]
MRLWLPSFLVFVSVGLSCFAHAEDDKQPADKPYVITPAAQPSPIGVGKPCEYQLTIAPKAPWALKTSTPLKVALRPSDGLKLAKATLSAADVVDPKPEAKTLRTDCEVVKGGTQAVSADLSFFLCTDQICQRYIDKANLQMQVP